MLVMNRSSICLLWSFPPHGERACLLLLITELRDELAHEIFRIPTPQDAAPEFAGGH